jgi:hypothetical protein
MTTMSEPSDRYRRIATTIAHHQAAALALAVITDTTLAITGYWHTLPGYFLSLIAALGVMVAMLAETRHARSLCERCAAKTPLDAEAAVAQRRWWLWTFHVTNSVPVLVALCLVYGVAIFLPVPKSVPGFLGMTPLFVFWAIAAAANLVHRPLEPWCPQCNWGDGGDEEQVPDPEPVPAATKTA